MALNTDAHSGDQAQLRQTVFWISVASAVSAMLYAVGAVVFASSSMAIMAVVATLTVVLSLLALHFVRRGRVKPAVFLTSGALGMWVIVGGLLAPALAPAIALVPVLLMALSFPFLDRQMLRVLSVMMLVLATVLMLLAQYVALFDPIPAPMARALTVLFVPAGTAIIILLFWQSYGRLSMALQQSQRANLALQHLQAGLEAQVDERTQALRIALVEREAYAAEQAQLREALEQQREVVRELSVPVLPVSGDMLVMPLVGVLDSARLAQVQEQALARLAATRARSLLIDITGVPVVDVDVAEGLIRVVRSARLLGCEVGLVGIRPEVAQTIVGLGLDLRGIRTSSSLQAGIGELTSVPQRWVR